MLFRPKEYIIIDSILFRPKIYVSKRIELEIVCGAKVAQRRKFAGSMWKKPEVLDRKSGADKWCDSTSNANLI